MNFVSIELINSIDNLNSNNIDICFGKYSNSGKLIYDSDNSLCFNYYGNTDLLKTLWPMSIYAKEYNERKYISYLTDKRVFSIFLDKDSFLYSTDESLNNAQKNRDKFALMFFKYADFED